MIRPAITLRRKRIVIDVDTQRDFFEDASGEDLMATLRRAEALWEDPKAWREVQARGMKCDFSWGRSAARYEKLYRAARRAGKGT